MRITVSSLVGTFDTSIRIVFFVKCQPLRNDDVTPTHFFSVFQLHGQQRRASPEAVAGSQSGVRRCPFRSSCVSIVSVGAWSLVHTVQSGRQVQNKRSSRYRDVERMMSLQTFCLSFCLSFCLAVCLIVCLRQFQTSGFNMRHSARALPP